MRGGRRATTPALLASLRANRVALDATRMRELRAAAADIGLKVRGQRLFLGERRLVPASEVKAVLRREYAAPKISGAIGRDTFHAYISRKFMGISRRATLTFLKSQRAYQLQQPVSRVPHTTSRPAKRPFATWQADLLDMGATPGKPRAYRYILTVLDIFSKYAYAKPLSSKSGRAVARAMASTFTNGRPRVVQTDNGTEFVNALFREALGPTKHVTSRPYTPQAQGAVERFNGTLKKHLCSAREKSRTYEWRELIAPFLKFYNEERVHSSTGFVPADVHDAALRGKVLKRVRSALAKQARRTRMRSNERRLPPLHAGDRVRVALTADAERANATFRKSTCINWSSDTFEVERARRDRTYTLRGYTRVYRRQELQKIEGLDGERGLRGSKRRALTMQAETDDSSSSSSSSENDL